MIVTIDGPAGSGKSTAARDLAARLGFRFLDTGAMYRAVAWACLDRGVSLDDHDAAANVARATEIAFDGQRVLADGRDVTAEIRSTDVTQGASVIAVNAEVRAALAEAQRRLARGLDVVAEGRDQGTHVFPDAEVKFFVTADPSIRARRRQEELREQGVDVSLEELTYQIAERDERDRTRDIAPLRPADDAIIVDSSAMSADDVLDILVRTVERVRSGAR